MNIAPKTVVSFHYTLRNASGEELESSAQDNPMVYLHGAGNIIPGLEVAMTGRAAGESFEVTVPPEQAYGPRLPDRTQRVPVKHLLFKGKLRPGMLVQMNTRDGRVPATVIKAGKFSADVDTNHPLAGETLTFAVEITDVRAATDEEMAHRHAHGPGGHQH